ncbi:MAG: DinB family protein [Candidatus Eisenbacteria bacterium]|nr:DinB family protein [Candidatus Eisenbacteria bacterium]
MSDDRALRDLLGRALSWRDAHAGFDAAVEGIPPEKRGMQPGGLPYSPWQLIEHIRLTQEDILDFCVNPNYKERDWPKDYWPSSPEPPSPKAWDESLDAYRKDREALQKLAADTQRDLAAKIPHGSGQTYQRELVLVVDHTAYHTGELVVVRRLLGIWKKG